MQGVVETCRPKGEERRMKLRRQSGLAALVARECGISSVRF